MFMFGPQSGFDRRGADRIPNRTAFGMRSFSHRSAVTRLTPKAAQMPRGALADRVVIMAFAVL
jgi:hypothetical protein